MIETKIGCFETPEEAIAALEKAVVVKKEEPISKLLFILTMPNVGSWNGKWTGEDIVYAKTKNVKLHPTCEEGNYYYSWDDGWGVKIEVKRVTVKEANKYLKKSNGFCGYDWMIDSILTHGKIKTND